jgi:segregation and condensation protein B
VKSETAAPAEGLEESEAAPPVAEDVPSEAASVTADEAAKAEAVQSEIAAAAAEDGAVAEPVETAAATETVAADELLPDAAPPVDAQEAEDTRLKALLEAVVYVAEEPLTIEQIVNGVGQPRTRVEQLLAQVIAEFDQPGHGVSIRLVAGGYKMATKPEHHESVRAFVKSLKAPLKLSLPALETLAVVAYKQPVTAPEIMEIRGVSGAGVLKTLLDRKLVAVAGRKNVVGKPMLYKTTKEFLIQFGLKDLSELPSLKEFEEIRRLAITDGEMLPLAEGPAEPAASAPPATALPAAPEPEAETGESESAAGHSAAPEARPSEG